MNTFKKLTFLLAVTAISIHASSPVLSTGDDNCSKWGVDSVKTLQALSVFKEFVKQKNYDAAYDQWYYVFTNAPGAKEYTHIDGAKILNHKIKNEKDNTKKATYIDLLMKVYDQRIQCFGNEGKVLGRKGVDMIKYKGSETEAIYNTFKKSVDLQKNKTQYFVLKYYFKFAIKHYQAEKLTKQQLLATYQEVNDIIEANASGKNAAKYKSTQENVAEEFINAKIVEDCKQAKELFEASYQAKPDDEKVLLQIFDVLRSVECIDDPLFIEVTQKLNEKNPEAKKAFFLGKAYAAQQKYAESKQFIQQAIELEEEKDKKADYTYYLAQIYRTTGELSSSRKYALEAASLKPNWGQPYLLIGDLYASSGSACGSGTDFKSHTVSWVAIDAWQQAKSVDPSVAAEANKNIARYAQYMPTQEEIFFQNLKVGGTYTVGCWINRSTKIRARQQ